MFFKISRHRFYGISVNLAGVEFKGQSGNYTAADTWYPSWATNNPLYSSFTDETWGLWNLVFSGTGPRAVTGQAKIVGYDPLTSKENLALQADVWVSSVAEGTNAKGVNDGVVEGFPGHAENEWASNQTVGATVRLSWNKKVKVGKIWLFDRPYQYEQILSGGLKMSDGTLIELGPLSNIEGEGLEVTFEPREVEWIEYVVLGVGESSHAGLSEFAVFEK